MNPRATGTPADPFLKKVAELSDGTRDVARISLALNVKPELVWKALDDLADLALLEQRAAPPAAGFSAARRIVTRAVAVGISAGAVLAFGQSEAVGKEASAKMGAEASSKEVIQKEITSKMMGTGEPGQKEAVAKESSAKMSTETVSKEATQKESTAKMVGSGEATQKETTTKEAMAKSGGETTKESTKEGIGKGGPGTTVSPEPATALIVGSALGALGFMEVRRKRVSAAEGRNAAAPKKEDQD